MPFKTYRFVVLEADTRTSEMLLASFTLLWSAWLVEVSLGISPTLPAFQSAILKYGGTFFWSGWGIINGIFQSTAVWWRYPLFRKWAACSAAILWIIEAWCLLQYDWRMLAGRIALFMAFWELWIVFHKSATTGKSG